MKRIKLNNGVSMPQLGFGTFQINDLIECEACVLSALKTGYRMIDTAANYGNESAVGKAIKRSSIPRNELFISSKVWLTKDGYQETLAAFEQTLKNLQTDYLDLYLIHMPYGDYQGSWRAMSELYQAGKIRAIGVCNFLPDRLVDLILTSGVIPAVNQIELHPFCQQQDLRQLMAKYQITPMAWAPFAEGQNHLFTNPILVKIGAKYGKSAAQVVLKWLEQSEISAIPKSVHLERMQENFALADFNLTEEDLAAITALDSKQPVILQVDSAKEAYHLHEL
ncbi:aldo/keto reductase [Lactobacillus sp. ESL0681]|uniref:aldo/keto reductase n=1 Tax=Lactobacillus sp. ESL0681 TaxID=2983211 RepID=UPI0023F6A4C8|nr:aldo/keto reductase [Lactobacillus sp. ESL0681]WEV39517.1 aldo/keto reductase [Lactobacillus sp. ESL0681]